MNDITSYSTANVISYITRYISWCLTTPSLIRDVGRYSTSCLFNLYKTIGGFRELCAVSNPRKTAAGCKTPL